MVGIYKRHLIIKNLNRSRATISKLLRFFCTLNLKVISNLKTVIIMANIEIKFKCETENGDFITVKEEDSDILITFSDNIGFKNDVILSKSTAIKFAKTLRTEINKIQS